MNSLSRNQMLALLKVAKQSSERDYVAILLGFTHGLRVSEILALTPANFKDGYLIVQRLKGSFRTQQPLPSHREPLLNEHKAVTAYLTGIGPKDRLFDFSRQYFDRIFKDYCVKAGIPRPFAHAHVLKHTCATLVIAEAGIENVRQWLGHKSIASTGAYLRVSDEQAAKAVSAAMRF